MPILLDMYIFISFIYFLFTAHNNKLHNTLVFGENERGQEGEKIISLCPIELNHETILTKYLSLKCRIKKWLTTAKNI